MARLNLTLDHDTISRLDQYARGKGKARSAIARELLAEALNRIDRHAKLKKLARDYAQGRDDAESLLADLEAGQLELLNA
jgi:predicted transcriptional regulator